MSKGKLVEYKVKHGDLVVEYNEKILSFAIDNGEVIFYSLVPEEKSELDPIKYVVLDTGDEIAEHLEHAATLVEGIEAKHIFVEYIPKEATPKNVTKVITDKGVETFEEDVTKDAPTN